MDKGNKIFLKDLALVLMPMAFGLIVLLLGFYASAAQAAPQQLVDKFLATNQEMAILYFRNNSENLENAISCLEVAESCGEGNLTSELLGEEIELEFDQEGLLELLQSQQIEYRTLVGLYSYDAIERGLLLGRGRMAITPIRGGGSLFFETRSEEGKEEWATLQYLYKIQQQEIMNFNEFFSATGFDLPEAKLQSMREILRSRITVMLQSFPFLRYLAKVDSSKENFIKAMLKLNRNYKKSIRHIEKLKGDDRFELFGFVAAYQASLEKFTEKEITQLEEHYVYIEKNTSLWGQIVNLFKSRYFWAMMTCWSAAIFLPPVGIVCGAIGLSVALPGVYELTKQVKRLNTFKGTGSFDHDMYARYMVGAVLQGAMYTILLRASIPDFVRNVRNVKKSTKQTRRKIKVLGGRAFASLKRFRQGEWALIKDYFKFYLKDFGSETAADVTMQRMGSIGLRSVLPNMQQSFQSTMAKVTGRQPPVFLYSDMLKMMRTAL